MIEIINEPQVEFATKIREYDLSHETDIRVSSLRLDAYLYDDGASFPSLGFKLEVVLDPPLTTLSLVAPSFDFYHFEPANFESDIIPCKINKKLNKYPRTNNLL